MLILDFDMARRPELLAALLRLSLSVSGCGGNRRPLKQGK